MGNLRIRRIILLVVLILVTLACGKAAPTPDPSIPLTMENICDYDDQILELEGQLILPRGVSCSSGEELNTCALTFTDPLNINSMEIFIPVSANATDLPLNYMAALPDEYQRNDFYVRTSDNRFAHDRSYIRVRGEIGSPCQFSKIESISLLDRLAYTGIEIRRLPLQQAFNEGLVEIEIKGMGLSQILLKIKPKIEINMEVEIQPGTVFIAGTEGVQNMVLRERELVYLKPQAEVSLELEVSCANMTLKQPTFEDIFSLSQDAPNEDLVRLFAVDDFFFAPLNLQQFAVWTITDNPVGTFDFVAIETGGYSHLPTDEDINLIRNLFQDAGIDLSKYPIFTDI